MSSADAVAAVLWVGATMYAVFGGADFGAGFWSLVAGGGERGRRARELIDWAIGPVWEANHVWLIFVLVVLWTGFSSAFAAIFSTLFIPLSLAALGIVLRGSGFAFHKTARRLRGRDLAERLFGLSSLLTPFFMGTVVGAIASGRVPPGNAAGDAVSSWLNLLSLLIGALFVATSAYVSAVFLVSDARRAGAADLERYFTVRALGAALVAGALAVAGIVDLHADAPYLYDRLTAEGLPLVIVSALCGLAVLVLLRRGAARGVRALAVAAVVAVVWGWGVAQYPYLLPEDADHRRRRRAERHAHGRADRLRRRGRARPAGDRPAVHAGAAEPDRGGGAPAGAAVAERARRARASEGKMRTERTAAPTNAAAVLERMWPCSTPIAVMATTSGSCVDANSASAARSSRGQLAPVEQEHGQAADDQEQAEEQRQLQQPAGARDQRVEVERDAARHEEERDQEPEADGVELRLEAIELLALEHALHEQAGRERAQDHVEPEVGGEHDEREHRQHGQPHRELPARLQRALEEVPAPSDGTGRERRGEHGDHHERDEQQRLGRGIGCRAEQQRDDQDGPELPDGADRQHVAAARRVELVGVAQQRDQRAERGRGHRRARQQARDHDAADLEQPASEYARASEHTHPIVARRSGVPRTRSKRIS